MSERFPILEYDDDKSAMLEATKLIAPHPQMPVNTVICFFQDVIDQLRTAGKLTEITSLRSEMGQHPIYRWENENGPVALCHPGVGAPLAAGLLEEVIALGARKFIVCGGAGSLDPEHALGKLLVPISAVRDEGTSYHYLPPGKETEPTVKALDALKATLVEKNIPLFLTKTWTTDAIYRETRRKIDLRRQEGCTCVEMEAAAFFAVARFRNVELAQVLYAGDDLSGEAWDSREWHTKSEIRTNLLQLAAAACLRIQ